MDHFLLSILHPLDESFPLGISSHWFSFSQFFLPFHPSLFIVVYYCIIVFFVSSSFPSFLALNAGEAWSSVNWVFSWTEKVFSELWVMCWKRRNQNSRVSWFKLWTWSVFVLIMAVMTQWMNEWIDEFIDFGHSSFHSFIYRFIHSSIHWSMYSSDDSFIHPMIHWCVSSMRWTPSESVLFRLSFAAFGFWFCEMMSSEKQKKERKRKKMKAWILKKEDRRKDGKYRGKEQKKRRNHKRIRWDDD